MKKYVVICYSVHNKEIASHDESIKNYNCFAEYTKR